MIKGSSLVKAEEGKQSFTTTFMQRLGPSMLSSLLISTLLYPFDTLKRCAQVNGGKGQLLLYRNNSEVYSKFVANHGFLGLYRGVHLFALNELVTAFIYVNAYEALSPHTFGIEWENFDKLFIYLRQIVAQYNYPILILI